MNYMWDLSIKAKNSGIPKEAINFIPAKVCSPYMELCSDNINESCIEKNVEVNPYYRFYEIFKDMFSIDNKDNEEFRNVLFDILMHFLTDIDINEGMNKKEYYEAFILQDIENYIFGEKVKESIKAFNLEERVFILQNILKLYTTGETLYVLKTVMKGIFKKSIVYSNKDGKDELIFYIGEEKSEVNKTKLKLITELFLPIKFKLEVYFEKHFGIIGVEETMRIDNIALY